MATLKELNLRLNSLGNTKKITQAMKLIATTKMSRSVQRVKNSQYYQSSLNQIMNKMIGSQEIDHVLTRVKNHRKIKVLLISADRGLCGAFNSNLFKELNHHLIQWKKEDRQIEMDFCGLKGFKTYEKSKFKIGENFKEIVKKVRYEDAVRLGEQKISQLIAGEMDTLYIAYNHYLSALVQKPTIKKLIPFEIKESSNRLASNSGSIYLEPNLTELADDLISKNFYFEIFYALLNSVAGENAARMRAMDSATKNCEDMIDSITLERNRVRQASITNELIEIISGSESL